MKKEKEEFVSCLRDETVIVRFIPRVKGFVTNPKHVFYGGMGDQSVKKYTVPISPITRTFVQVLNAEEEAYLEQVMNVKPGTLSIYNKEDNYWENYYVRLTKQDTRLLLKNPEDYIRYKVLLANTEYIASSLEEYKNRPKETHLFYLLTENAEVEDTNKDLSETQEAWKNYGKYENELDVLKYVVEVANGRRLSKTTKPNVIKSEVFKVINSNAKLFNDILSDAHLKANIVIVKAVEAGIINKKGDYYYHGTDALCANGEEPLMTNAAKYLDHPKNQTLRLSIEAKLEA